MDILEEMFWLGNVLEETRGFLEFYLVCLY